MLKEPRIKKKDLKNILNPVLIVVGSNDCIKEKHTLKNASFLKTFKPKSYRRSYT